MISFRYKRSVTEEEEWSLRFRSESEDAKTTMAWFHNEYGPVEVLQSGEIPAPIVGPGQVLIKVLAAALDPVDSKIRQHGFLRKLDAPFPMVPGCDLAGVVAEIGDSVTRFKKGDEVYGDIQDFTESLKRVGTLSVLTVAEEHLLAKKPRSLSFVEAASLPLAYFTVVQAFNCADFHEGQTVLIVGGVGGVGSLAIQLAKYVFKASIVASTSSPGKVEYVKSLGADLVFDHPNFDEITEKFDFVLDTSGESSKSYVVAKEDGKIVDIASFPPHSRALPFIVKPHGSDLKRLGEYIESGQLKPVIDPNSPYTFRGVVEAFNHLESGQAEGKIVIYPIE